MDEDKEQVKREVERFASEFGVSIERAWAEREKWEAEHAISFLERLVQDGEAAARLLASELGAARREVQQRKRTLAAARRKQHRAITKLEALTS